MGDKRLQKTKSVNQIAWKMQFRKNYRIQYSSSNKMFW